MHAFLLSFAFHVSFCDTDLLVFFLILSEHIPDKLFRDELVVLL